MPLSPNEGSAQHSRTRAGGRPAPVVLGLIGTNLILAALAVSGILRVIANADATRAEIVLAWIAVAALPLLLVALVALLVRATRIR
jgi:hypothetical protein